MGSLPQELYEEIITHLSDEIDSLKSCALAFRALVEPSQKSQFSTITIRGQPAQSNGPNTNQICTSGQLRRLLSSSTHLAIYVHNLEIQARGESVGGGRWAHLATTPQNWLSTDVDLPHALSHLKDIKSFDLENCPPVEWENFMPSIRSSIIEVISLPSLRHLTLSHVPASLSSHAIYLTTLTLDRTKSAYATLFGATSITPTTPLPSFPSLHALTLSGQTLDFLASWLDGDTTRHFPALKKLDLFVDYSNKQAVQLCLQSLQVYCTDLEEIIIAVDGPFQGQFASAVTLDFASFTALRRISFECLADSFEGSREWVLQGLRTCGPSLRVLEMRYRARFFSSMVYRTLVVKRLPTLARTVAEHFPNLRNLKIVLVFTEKLRLDAQQIQATVNSLKNEQFVEILEIMDDLDVEIDWEQRLETI